jgi:Domain of unknown function (DUF3368)
MTQRERTQEKSWVSVWRVIFCSMYGPIIVPFPVKTKRKPGQTDFDGLVLFESPRGIRLGLDGALKAHLEERDAITLATELRADRLIVDDREGRREAERRGIPVIGTLGVLREAAALKLLDIRVAVERLQATSFFVAPEVLTKLLKDFA